MFSFTVRQIEVFLAACDEGGFRRAAARLGISEAGVSQHLRALEDQLGYPLFDRRRGAKSVLSVRGQHFAEEARSFVNRGIGLSRADGRDAMRPVTLYVGGHLLEDYIRPALPAFTRSHPDIVLNFAAERPRSQLWRDVRDGQFDAVLIAVPDATLLPGSILISRVEGGIFGVAEMRAKLKSDGLAGLPYIFGVTGSEVDLSQSESLRDLGVTDPIVAARTQFHDTAVRLAAQGDGVLMTLRSIVAGFDHERRLTLLYRRPPWERRLLLNKNLPRPVAAALTDFVRRTIAEKDRANRKRRSAVSVTA
jgi:DNA-binding transcriptional LysR family regulator